MDEPSPEEHPEPGGAGGPVKADHRFGFVACLAAGAAAVLDLVE